MRKLRTSSRHLLAEKRAIHGTLNIFFRNKTFLSFKVGSWNFQRLFDSFLHETSQNSKSNNCWKFQLSILTNKKGLFLKKDLSVPCTMYNSFFSQKMPYFLLNLLPYMALKIFITKSFSFSGWFMWYCRFYLGRRSRDDDRQIGRWKNCTGPKGKVCWI